MSAHSKQIGGIYLDNLGPSIVAVPLNGNDDQKFITHHLYDEYCMQSIVNQLSSSMRLKSKHSRLKFRLKNATLKSRMKERAGGNASSFKSARAYIHNIDTEINNTQTIS